jgi:Uma2 family endonuclease
MMPVDTRLTYDDLSLLPDDGKRYEIIEGELFVTLAPRILHQVVVSQLLFELLAFVRREGLGRVLVAPVDVVLSEFDIVEPDLVYVSNQHLSIITEKNVVGAPDLVIEVLSESTEKRDRTTKLKLYARFGVLEYWIINPYGPSADVYRRGESGLSLAATLAPEEALTSPLLPGFSAPLHRLIA